MRIVCMIFLLCNIHWHVLGQGWTFDKSVDVAAFGDVSIDRAGNLYYATIDGDVVKMNDQLEEQLVFSPSTPTTTDILEAWQGLRIFTFHKELQIYRLINRNLSLGDDYTFPSELVQFAEIATPSFDNNIWVINQTDFSLKKYDIHTQRLQSITYLDLLLDQDDYELLHCREYQNRLFVSTRSKGILIFDNFGNYIKTFEYNAIGNFSFWDNELYFLDQGNLVKIDLYEEKQTVLPLPPDQSWESVLIFDQTAYLFSKNSLYRFYL
jgi:hypothetical protein